MALVGYIQDFLLMIEQIVENGIRNKPNTHWKQNKKVLFQIEWVFIFSPSGKGVGKGNNGINVGENGAFTK